MQNIEAKQKAPLKKRPGIKNRIPLQIIRVKERLEREVGSPTHTYTSKHINKPCIFLREKEMPKNETNANF